jgi:unsaturated chondroitin disaccharide hydrolase
VHPAKDSVLSAADELVALEATNALAGTIPTKPTSSDTIIDSMMNIAILPWASQVTGNPVYSQVALHNAQVVASVLVRPDGSTAQSVKFDPTTGQVLYISTHQGLSATSTWSRGQGWAVYGFAQAAVQLHDVSLLRVSLRAAEYVQGHLPANGIPLWDYDAPAGAPVDVSAGVITAAGLVHLADACQVFPGTCTRPGQWVTLARRMLRASLGRASVQPPLGLLVDQVLHEGPKCWCNCGELIFGLTYALEADNLLRGR